MALGKDEYAKRALDFVERLQSMSEFDDISRELLSELEWFGFTYLTTWSMPGPGESPLDGVLLNNRPADYVDHYVEKNHILYDPVISELRKNTDAFSWGDVRKTRNLSKSEIRIMDEARDFDVREGFIVPIMSASGSIALVSPCGRDPNLTPRARSALEIIGIYGYQALRRALVRRERAQTRTPLTPREREIMHWVAAGKTDDEIADILSISTTTVTSHVENAKLKLDAFKRTYAIVQAIRFGEISL